MVKTDTPDDRTIDLSILTNYKILEYIDLLANHPKGLSRVEIREQIPISSTPEMKCTEILFNAGFIVNARVLKGKKFVLTKSGLHLWQLLHTLDIFIQLNASKASATDDEIDQLKSTTNLLLAYTHKLEKEKQKIDTLDSLF